MEHMAMLHALVCVHALLDATAFLLLLLAQGFWPEEFFFCLYIGSCFGNNRLPDQLFLITL